MPAINPFIDSGANIEAWDGSPLITQSTLYQSIDPVGGAYVQNFSPGIIAVNAGVSNNSTNAAGTSENLAMHVAILVVVVLVLVYALRESGFKFVTSAGIGR